MSDDRRDSSPDSGGGNGKETAVDSPEESAEEDYSPGRFLNSSPSVGDGNGTDADSPEESGEPDYSPAPSSGTPKRKRRDSFSSIEGGKGNESDADSLEESSDQDFPFVFASATPQPILRLEPDKDHEPETYDDLQLDFDSSLFRALEKHLPPSMFDTSRDDKVNFMKDIPSKYLNPEELNRAERLKEYRQTIISNYKPLHKDLFDKHPANFFVDSFARAVFDNTEESFRSILSEPSPGVFTFDMFPSYYCNLLIEEVENFEKWVTDAKVNIMRPNRMNMHGAVLDDFGFEVMLDELMYGSVRPISKDFFPEIGGQTLNSHHGFVVEYGENWDLDLGLHVDDAEVTLNVCLGKKFSDGELFFQGTRCENHANTDSQPEEKFNYSHVPGKAVLHRGCHRHGVRRTTSGRRVNLILWCRSSEFRELKRYQTDCSAWCGECKREKEDRKQASFAAMKSALLRSDGGSTP